MSRKHKKFCTTHTTYIKYFLTLASTITECISISAFASLLGILSSGIGLKICAITAAIKKHK